MVRGEEMNMEDNATVCIVGLGYVGLPLAEAFSSHIRVIGYDVDEAKVAELNRGEGGIEFTTEFDGDSLPVAPVKKSFKDSRERIWFGFDNGQIAVLEKAKLKSTCAVCNNSTTSGTCDCDDLRWCTECGKSMKSGCILYGGEEYYCSDACIDRNYTDGEQKIIFKDAETDDGESYYTDWD